MHDIGGNCSTGTLVVAFGLFPSYFVCFRTMEYVETYKSFILVTSYFVCKVPMEMENYISLAGTSFYSLSLHKNTSFGKDTYCLKGLGT